MDNKYLKKIDLKNKILLVNILIILFICLIVFLIILPNIQEISVMQSNIQNQYLDLENKYLKGQSLKKLSESLNTIEPRVAKLDEAFISQDKQLDFVTSLESLAAKNNITQKISMGTQSTYNNYQKMPIILTTEGNYNNQMRYLNDLLSTGKLLNIRSVEISPVNQNNPGDASASGQVNIIFTLDTFWK